MVISYYIYYKIKFLEFFPKLILDRILIPLQVRYYRREKYRLLIWLFGNFIQLVYTVLTELLVITYGKPKSYLDRKSTRLNSSHVKISYAVFCLKKKKIKDKKVNERSK